MGPGVFDNCPAGAGRHRRPPALRGDNPHRLGGRGKLAPRQDPGGHRGSPGTNTTMTNELSILNLVLNASWVVKLVMILLLGVSVASWAAIFRKLIALKRVNSLDEDFEKEFWSGTSLNDLYAAAVQ